jgi:hypothetical protein
VPLRPAAAAPAISASRHVMYEIVLGTVFTVRVPSDVHEGELAPRPRV